MSNFYYVYILKSKLAKHHYVGITKNLLVRLAMHNNGQVPHTSKYRPWQIETTIAFSSQKKAFTFEKYLKSHSGRAFAAKHF